MITQSMMQDALRYIGIPAGNVPDEEIKQKVEIGFKRLEEIANPKITYQKVKINKEENQIILQGTHCKIASKDLMKLFAHSHECILMAATLGLEVDRQIINTQKIDMLEAMILDSCASVMVEELCDQAEAEIMKTLNEYEYLTMRFSPGYGDVPLELSADLLDILAAQKRMGLTLTKTHMLLPTKSITALIGISNQKENRLKTCGHCNLVKTCMYRGRGERCGL